MKQILATVPLRKPPAMAHRINWPFVSNYKSCHGLENKGVGMELKSNI
ncbi:MAG: hypothetical protein GXZ06_06370 [Tissierellia bacterium]|nr:hypothetical protein [Tissierellia bacterium]